MLFIDKKQLISIWDQAFLCVFADAHVELSVKTVF